MLEPERVVLDCDPGHDDAIALLVAAKADEINLEAVTVVAGNHKLEKTMQNTLNICSAAGLKDIPIYAGMKEPMVRKQLVSGKIHGDSGLGGPTFPPTDLEAEDTHAVDYLIETVTQKEEPLTIVPTGPLSNIAMALKKQPDIKENIKEVCLMGGACGIGNVTPAAEANIHHDPEAAKVVFESGLPITMVGLGLTHQAKAYPSTLEEIERLDNRISDLVVEILEFFGVKYKEVYDFDAPPLHDVCAIAKIIDSNVFTKQKKRVDIEVKSDLTRGRTVCDFYECDFYETGVHERETKKNASVAMKLNEDLFWDIVLKNLAKY